MMKSKLSFPRQVWALAVAAALTAALPAQSDEYVTNSNLRGVVPLATYQFDGIDNVNLGTGAVNLTIGLFSRQGRGPAYSQTVFYSSKIWMAKPIPHPQGAPVAVGHNWLPSFGQEAKLGGVRGDLVYTEQTYTCTDSGGEFFVRVRSNFIYTSPLGGTHRFPNRDFFHVDPADSSRFCSSVVTTDYPVGTSDSGVMELDTSQTDAYFIRFKDGSQENFDLGVHAVRDSNGNFIDIPGGDTLGRSYPYNLSTGVLTVKDSGGAPADYVLDYAFIPVATAFPTTGCSTINYDIQQYNGTLKVLDKLTLPSGLSYDFSYDSQFGELTRIDLPTGGYIRYVYTTLPEFDQSPDFDPCLLDSRRVAERRVSPDGVVEHVWTYSYTHVGSYTTTVTDPLGNRTVHVFNQDGIHELEREVRQGLSTPLRRFINSWDQDVGPVQGQQDGLVEAAEKNWRITAADTVLTVTNQESRTETDYDSYSYNFNATNYTESRMNPTETREFDYGAGAPGPLLRTVQFTWLQDSSTVHRDRHIWDRPSSRTVLGTEGPAAVTEFYYDTHALTPTLGIVQHDYSGYPASMPWRGNLTRRRDWLDTESRWIESLQFYDDLGNLVRSVAPKGSEEPGTYETLFGYNDDWEPSPACPPPGQTRAFVTSTTNALGHVASRSHYSCSSLTESVTDANGRTTGFQYDLLDRAKRIDNPDGGVERRYYSDLESTALHHQTGSPVFPDQTQLPLRTKTYSLIESSPFLEMEVFEVADGLGRQSLRGLLNGSEMDWTGTEYDDNGRVFRVSNPLTLFYGFSSDVPDPGFVAWTTTTYDGLDRPVEDETPDGNSVTTVYSGNRTTVTDQVGAARRSITDALGRVVEVREPDPQTGSLDSGNFTDTRYTYDLLDHLTAVLQGTDANDQDGGGGGTSQSRSFLYDSLGRLIEESHPESGTARYAYDDNGNVIEKVDSRGRRAAHDYDMLNRIVSTSYSVEGDPSRTDTTPPVSYFYDGSTSLNRRGRLSTVTDGAGTSSFEYDSMGRISRSVRTTRGKTLSGDYAYTFLGGVKTASYQGVSPSGYTLVYGYDSQGRQKTLSDGGGNPFITGYAFGYDLTDALEETDFANGTIEAVTYNNRLQPQQRIVYDPSFNELMDQYYFFDKPGGGGNNGNIWEIGDFKTFQSRHFDYDKLNRLTGATGAGWSIDYSYDRFGNRLSAVGSGSPPGFQGVSLSIDPSTNRITSPGWEYDDAGNVVEDGGAHHFVWDSAGRLIEMGPPQPSSSGPPGDDGRCTVPPCPPPPPPPPDPPPPLDDGRSSLRPGLKAQTTGTMFYEYDFLDRRVVKDEGDLGRIYFWDEVMGEVIWEFPLEAPGAQDVVRGYFNGRLVVENDTRPGAGLHFMHRDHLGTSKLMTDFSSATVVCDEVYHPFGQLQTSQPGGCNAHVRKFTGKERDPESELDYFGARYSDSVTGRFVSADPLLDSASTADPQSWNRYSYVLNNPLRFVDPDGRNAIAIEAIVFVTVTVAIVILVLPRMIDKKALAKSIQDIEDTAVYAYDSALAALESAHATAEAAFDTAQEAITEARDDAVEYVENYIMFEVIAKLVPTTIDSEPIEARSGGGKKAKDSSKNEPHGDEQALEKLDGQIQDLKDRLAELERTQGSKREKVKLRTKIRNLEKEAARARKGGTHGRRGKGPQRFGQ